jgi:hypothetical protein
VPLGGDNPYGQVAAYQGELLGRNSLDEPLPCGEFMNFLQNIWGSLDLHRMRLCFAAHLHVFTADVMQEIAKVYWSAAATEYCKTVVNRDCAFGGTVVVVGAGGRAQPEPDRADMEVLLFDAIPRHDSVREVTNNESPLVGEGSATYVVACDTYSNPYEQRAITERDVSELKPDGVLMYASAASGHCDQAMEEAVRCLTWLEGEGVVFDVVDQLVDDGKVRLVTAKRSSSNLAESPCPPREWGWVELKAAYLEGASTLPRLTSDGLGTGVLFSHWTKQTKMGPAACYAMAAGNLLLSNLQLSNLLHSNLLLSNLLL